MTTDLVKKWAEIKQLDPKVRIRDAAKKLEVSEADLLGTGIGDNVTLLAGDFRELLKEIESLGRVMALTRNEHCVHERKGIYKKVSFKDHVGLAVNPDIDLRLFMNVWKYGYAVNENGRLSFQFFDDNGEAVHKIYLTNESNQDVFETIRVKYTAGDQNPPVIIHTLRDTQAANASDVDVDGFQEAWVGMEDTHEFFGILKRFSVPRRLAMDIAPQGFAAQLNVAALKDILKQASESKTEIMVFTGSRGCIQIHTGLITNIVQTGPWFNVLDPDFNMHLREVGIESVWLVKKPTKDGDVHSVEVYDEHGEIIVQFFGKRKPGIPESPDWRKVLGA